MKKLEADIAETVSYLSSNAAAESIKTDPYWPKWNSPWWRMLLLYETSKADLIPKTIMDTMIAALNDHYLKLFPFYVNEIPEGNDPYRHIMCHCGLGSIYKVLRSGYDNIDSLLPWARPWFVKYQLPDGGLNCDEQSYTNSKKSSIVSSLPVYEAVLKCAETGLTKEEEEFLDKGAEYLISHRLIYRSNGVIMDESFLNLQFPRFYSYDILRGLSFLSEWRKIRNKDNADEVIDFGYDFISKKLSAGKLKIERCDLKNSGTLIQSDSGEWVWNKEAKLFPLLDRLSVVGEESEYLTSYYDNL
jgi:hypothetical protein